MRRPIVLWLALLTLVAGCAAPATNTPSSSPGGGATNAGAPARTGPKRVTVAIHSAPPTLNSRLNLPSAAGYEVAEELIHSGLTTIDHQGTLHPVLAESVPTADNGLWKLNADGSMETTWKLRPGATWHDGAPLTAEDFVFTMPGSSGP